MTQKYPMTLEGKKRLKEELNYLKNKKQKEINDEIKHLRGFCDFSEDSTFRNMLKQQALLNDKIENIKEMLDNAEIIDSSDRKSSIVRLGSTVTFIELPRGEKQKYTIVGTIDADPIKNKISKDSPIGKSLLGNKINDELIIKTPSENIKIKIIDIS